MMGDPNKNTANCLMEILEAHTAQVCVVGLGYVGLPMALAFSEVGFPVCGFDMDANRVEKLSQGKSYISDVSDDQLQVGLSQGTFRATSDPEVLGQSDVILICVPTPLAKSKDPDLRAILGATETHRT
jgi:UDP-N-acetyl-D-glucosamine dehydrogenase